ncbi:MAG: hypothetical protein KDJ35_03905 [Alphaproteobacteria bacterium]|nr:hypothetical protein [Alphaproteobacteria bacterium]
MDIDLLFTESSEAGLICSENTVKKVIGAVLDTKSGILTLEYADSDFMETNIPVDPEHFPALDQTQQLHIGAVKDGHIAQAYQIPLMFQDDPYRGEVLARARQHPNPLQAFEFFVKHCVRGQPVFRDDLGDESTMGCILGDAVPSSLQFAPHLARRHALEAKPQATPSGLGPSGPGLGSGGGSVSRSQPPKKSD